VNIQSKNALKILHLLLRCGMVCREELNLVLEMMPAVPDGRIGAMEERAGAGMPQRKQTQCREATEPGEAAAPQSRQQTLILEFDNRV
jgi:hypothetical protein